MQSQLLDSVKSNNLTTFTNLIDSGAQINESIIKNAIENKSYQIIDFINSFNNSFEDNSLNVAISLNDIPMIDYLLSKGCNWTIYSFSYGVGGSNIDVLSYMKSKGCYWGILHQKHINIIKSNNSIVQWLKTNNCPWKELNGVSV